MANPSKLSLYIAGVEVGYGLKTKIQPRLVISNEQLRSLLEEEASYLMMLLAAANLTLQEFAGKVRFPASLEVAIGFLVDYVAPLAAILKSHGRHFVVEVMFNDPTITSVVKNKHLDKWRANNFQFKKVSGVKHPILHGGKWAALDETLSRLGGTILSAHDDVLRNMVHQLKTSRRKTNDSTDE